MGLAAKIVLVFLALVLASGLCDRWYNIWRHRKQRPEFPLDNITK